MEFVGPTDHLAGFAIYWLKFVICWLKLKARKQRRSSMSDKNNTFNPLVTNGLSHPYHLDESIFIFRDISSIFFIFILFFDEFHVSKQNSPKWDAAFCGVTSGAILFVYIQ